MKHGDPMKTGEDTMRARLVTIALALGAGLAAAACGPGPGLDTRTYELAYLEPEEAAEMVAPYVYADRPDAPGVVSHFPGGITVRETPDNLAKIDRALERFDRVKPAVRLHFQIIEADGSAEADPRIADVEAALRELFRFDGYRLVAEAQMGAVEGGSSMQTLRPEERNYGIRADVRRIRPAGGRGAVELSVALFTEDIGTAIETSMSVPAGQTVVLGSAQPYPDQPTLILTVRPELISAGDGAPAPEEGEPANEGEPETRG